MRSLMVLVVVLCSGLVQMIAGSSMVSFDCYEKIDNPYMFEQNYCTVYDLVLNPGDDVQSPEAISHVYFLKFFQSRLLFIPYNLFNYFSNLKTLDMSHTELLEVSRNTFARASLLMDLNLSNNNISVITNLAFHGASELVHLDISNNQITELSQYAFKDLPQLESLTLSHNQIRNLHPELFYGNPRIQTVDFQNNQLAYIEPEVFSSLTLLKIVDLSNNQINRIDPSTFSLSNGLRKLLLSGNNLTELQLNGGGANVFAEVDLSNNQLTDLCVNTTRTVNVENNRIELIHFSNRGAVEELHLRNNSISDIGNITELTKLTFLDLSLNPIGQINVSSFARLPDLRTLYLRGIGIQYLSYGMFGKQQYLRRLDLAYNNLSSLNLEIFVPALNDLNVLFLDGNNISQIDGKYAFSDAFDKLEQLGISRNRFNCSYLHSLLMPPKLNPLVKLNIESDSTDDEVTHIRDVSCASSLGDEFKTATMELEDLTAVHRLLIQSVNVMRQHQSRLEIYLVLLKITLGALIVLLVGAFIIRIRKSRHRRQHYFRHGNIVHFHSDVTNTNTNTITANGDS